MHAGGRGRGDFDACPPPSFGPNREATLGTAARPGQQVPLASAADTAALAELTFNDYPQALQVQRHSMNNLS